MKSEKIKKEEEKREKTHAESCFVSFKSSEEIRKENEARRAEINKFNNGLRGEPYHPKDSELTVTYGPNYNSNNTFN